MLKTMLMLSNVYMQRPTHVSSSGMRYQTWKRCTDEAGPEGVLISPLPWYYPRLFADLRRLHLAIHVWKAAEDEGWVFRMTAHLSALVKVMEYGRRLKKFILTIPLGQDPKTILDVNIALWDPLKAMEIRGSIRVDVLGNRSIEKDGISLKEYLTKIMSAEYVDDAEDDEDESRI
ncbi:hypothetical protein AMS68_000647 [Peltaster fructicola]|uniref:Uncharacterized protein n=1 Tax=Peltaster fructicola TaxID=286661 RepID=A0A6H0XKU8_9PEZI|nr:hypothetical protein AMS68_000647 [Peltaster fructicola]